MSDFVDLKSGLPSRRAVLGAAAWSVPVIAMVTATPAFAASLPPVADVFEVQAPVVWNLRAGGHPGPVEMIVQFGYYSGQKQYPGTVPFTWVITVSGPQGNHTVASGSDNLPRWGTWQKSGIFYPSKTGNLASGTYTFTFTVTAGGGSNSSSSKIAV